MKKFEIEKEKVFKCLNLEEILIYFQPIVFLKGLEIIGVEALTRGVRNGKIVSPLKLFSEAEEMGVKVELDRVCRDIAFKEFSKIFKEHKKLMLFFNFDGSIIDLGGKDSGFIYRLANKYGLPPEHIVIEITEKEVKSTEALKDFVENYKSLGFLIALDDVGVEYSNLNRIPELKPNILKIDTFLIRGIEKEYFKEKVVKALVFLAKEIGALTLAEGIETEEEALKTLEMGINFCQGFFFFKPAPLENKELYKNKMTEKFSSILLKFHSKIIEYFKKRKRYVERWKFFVKRVVESLHEAPPELFEEILLEWVKQEKDLECLYVVNMEGSTVTNTIFTQGVKIQKAPIFTPASIGKNLLLREYVYPIVSGLFNSFITEPYVSLATGNLVVTISMVFKNEATDQKYILCADFQVRGA